MRKISCLAALVLVLGAGAASAQDRPVLGRNGGAPVRAEAPVTEEGLVGRWGDNGNCNADTEFKSDGSFASSASEEGRWALNGDQLTMESGAGAAVYSVLMMNADNIRFTSADGAVKFSKRCG